MVWTQGRPDMLLSRTIHWRNGSWDSWRPEGKGGHGSLSFTCGNFLFSFWDWSLPHTWIGEDPCGDVCPRAHDVFNIQTGLHTSLSCSLSAYNPVHLRMMLKAPAKHAHEFSQVCRAVVLLQELKENGLLVDVSGWKTCFFETLLWDGPTWATAWLLLCATPTSAAVRL